MALELKYRPKSLDDVAGNSETLDLLENAFSRDEDSLKHTIMFSGPKGCGKTTLARICADMAKCSEVHEYDIGNMGGVDVAREIKVKVPYKPMSGGNLGIILDEVHEGSSKFFNAMLKTLEEPPKHVFFFLCTTDPQKVLPTVKSRCARYEVGLLSQKEMVSFLERVSDREEKENEDLQILGDTIELIARASRGTPREALIMLDQSIGLKPEQQLVFADQAQVKEAQVKELCQALLKKKKWKYVATIIKGLKEDPESIRRAVLGYMSAVLLNSGGGQSYVIMDSFREPFFNTGKAGLTLACYESIEG